MMPGFHKRLSNGGKPLGLMIHLARRPRDSLAAQMISFLVHVLFIGLIGTAAVLVVHEHERDVWLAYLLKLLVVIVGSAAILHRLPLS